MKILVIGSGGREHALIWKLAQSRHAPLIYCADGNAGIASIAECLPTKPDDMQGLVRLVEELNIDLTIVGPELPLTMGLVDELERRGRAVFGPSRGAARLEGSKVFAKDLMKRYGIPTAGFATFRDAGDARTYIRNGHAPCVVKADGLAAGKGALVCPTAEDAVDAVDLIMSHRSFGTAGDQIVIEEMMRGEEVSLFAVTDGKNYVLLPAAQDHKRIRDGDAGKNTGGMGAYAPAPAANADVIARACRDIVEPTLSAMEKEGCTYRGVLYCGLMLTSEGPKVVEFNCRFGDPECQALMPLIQSDLVDLCMAVAERRLSTFQLDLHPQHAVCVVMASGGYPENYDKGIPIDGIDAAREDGIVVFHAGTAMKEGRVVTSGGRVLGVTGVADDLQTAVAKAYRGVRTIKFARMHYRTDIAHRALNVPIERKPGP